MKKTLSIRMVEALLRAKALLGDEALSRIADFVRSQKLPDDSFMDKSGRSDLYYTAFGWLLCLVLEIPISKKNALAYLDAQSPENLDLVHYSAYMRCRLLHQLRSQNRLLVWLKRTLLPTAIDLKTLRAFPHDDAHDPYSLFLRLSLMEDAGKRISNPEWWLECLHPYQITNQSFGSLNESDAAATEQESSIFLGFSNIKGSSASSINASVAALSVLGQLKGYNDSTPALFLKTLQHESGGFAASSAAPLPDLLSTATTLFVLNNYRLKPITSPRDFVDAHWNEQTGGFSATLLEETSDVEYTFYGLLALGSL